MRNQIPSKIIEWYKDDITFLVDKDNCFIEAIIPITSWVNKIPYKVFEDECMVIVEIILNIPRDVNAERFGTYEEFMRCVGKRFSKTKMVPKGKKVKKSFEEAYASSSKVSKSKHISKKSTKVVIVESDEENLEKVCVQKSASARKLVIASPTSFG